MYNNVTQRNQSFINEYNLGERFSKYFCSFLLKIFRGNVHRFFGVVLYCVRIKFAFFVCTVLSTDTLHYNHILVCEKKIHVFKSRKKCKGFQKRLVSRVLSWDSKMAPFTFLNFTGSLKKS